MCAAGNMDDDEVTEDKSAEHKAADIVFGADCPIVMAGLDVTEQARILPDDVVRLARRAGSTPDDSIALARGEDPGLAGLLVTGFVTPAVAASEARSSGSPCSLRVGSLGSTKRKKRPDFCWPRASISLWLSLARKSMPTSLVGPISMILAI